MIISFQKFLNFKKDSKDLHTAAFSASDQFPDGNKYGYEHTNNTLEHGNHEDKDKFQLEEGKKLFPSTY